MGRPLDEMSFTVTRRSGAWTAGAWVPATGAPVTFALLASKPQPVGPELLEMLPEGARTSARYVIYAADDQSMLYLIEDATHAADYVAYDGKAHLVTSAEKWAGMPLGYRAYVLLEATNG